MVKKANKTTNKQKNGQKGNYRKKNMKMLKKGFEKSQPSRINFMAGKSPFINEKNRQKFAAN